ncbi:hypothetical protein [Maricaulis sp.]|uniref:hypothetical protein n=1 Tax=Maricaulis sp. TaxID=1486257 RepID=UPI001B2AC7D8|nr:hypothetical protein [Maricaulis sp.]MBO6795673.1 hypothetical protein [Maricaulis sp.]
MNKTLLIAGASMLALSLSSGAALASDPQTDARIAELEDRIAQLEETNRRLLEYLESQQQPQGAPHHSGPSSHHQRSHAPAATQTPAPQQHASHHADHHGENATGGYVGLSSEYSFRMLDHAENVNNRQLIMLQAMQNGELNNRVTLGGGLTVLANYQRSNSDTKFGWLMRHPTSNNQIGEEVSEFVVHAASLQTTARFSDNITGYLELLYNPEQSFGSGTITDLNRNQIQMRKAYVLFGNLDETPWYAAIGKMDTPFGLQDTVSPFTNSTTWHAFAGLAYGGLVGYYNNGFHLRAMGIQGGSQFRAHNTSVQGTNVPSRVNNFAVDANYTADLGNDNTLLVGASYTHGSTYCTAFPVLHFNPCADNNPAYSVYGRLEAGAFTLLGEFASTTDVWPGSHNPNAPLNVFEAVETSSWALGGRYDMDIGADSPLAFSFEFSRFTAGDEGSPWEDQDQWVGGLSYFATPTVKLFGEVIHTEGWVPLNFLSGGTPGMPINTTWSEADAETDVITVGVQAAF